jgi:phosphotransferase system  glucose/maltose/N-acetylglucosamine-specific IIC component
MFTKFINKNNFIITGSRILAFLFAVFGVWSSFDRDMFSKLFLGFSFDYWPEERPAVLFFVVTLSIIAVYVFMAYYTLKMWECQKRNAETSE